MSGPANTGPVDHRTHSKVSDRKSPALDGFIVLFKSRGITSNAPIYMMRRHLKGLKIGQTGTLDPLATGLLVIALGEATKLVRYLDENRKVYIAQLLLGQSSDTYDIEGHVKTIDPSPDISREKILEMIDVFVGSYMQTPPAHSAVKVHGKPAYSYARKGIKVELAQKQVDIYELDLVWYSRAKAKAAIRIVCSKGTYVRSLISDIGKSLGCGALMTKLTRTASGQFDIQNILTFNQLENILKTGDITEHMIKMKDVSYNVDSIELSAELTARFIHGQRIPIDEISSGFIPSDITETAAQKDPHRLDQVQDQNADNTYLVRDKNYIPIGIGKISDGILSPERVIGKNV